MDYYAVCMTALDEKGKPRKPHGYEYAWGEAENYNRLFIDYAYEEVLHTARLWAFEKINRSVVRLEIFNAKNRMVYGRFCRITKQEEKEIMSL